MHQAHIYHNFQTINNNYYYRKMLSQVCSTKFIYLYMALQLTLYNENGSCDATMGNARHITASQTYVSLNYCNWYGPVYSTR